MEAVKKPGVKEPHDLSKRIQWLRDYYFQGDKRSWNNEFSAFTTGTPWDEVFDETSFLIVPEVYSFFSTFRKSFLMSARTVEPPKGFFTLSLPERRAWIIKETIVNRVPQEILPGDLIAGGRFNVMVSRCWSKEETKARNERMLGKGGIRKATFEFQDRGYGNCGATSGHLIPDYPLVLREGFAGIKKDVQRRYDALSISDQAGEKGGQLRGMLLSCDIPIELAAKYAALCDSLAKDEADDARKAELMNLREVLLRVPKEPARNFYEALQSLWLTHMLVLTDENYPGAGVSFGRIDQYLLPYWQESMKSGMDREFGKELLKCFWMHCNFAYDAMIQTGNQGITAGYGQLFNLSGLGKGGVDLTNELTWVFLEVIDEMSPILEPKPNVRLHKNSPEALLDKVVDMISTSQGAPFLLNFDERSMAGMLEEAKRAHVEHLINEDNVFDYASVGCLENTMCGNDRSATVDCNPNLVKAVELTLGDGQDLITYTDALWGKPYPAETQAPKTGDPRAFADFETFYEAFLTQLTYVIDRMVSLYERSTALRASAGSHSVNGASKSAGRSTEWTCRT